MAMKASLLNLHVSATQEAGFGSAILEAKSLAARLHINVALDYQGKTYFIHATTDLDTLTVRHHANLRHPGLRED